MNEKLQLIIEETKKKWGLDAYRLKTHSIFLEKNIASGHAYILSMEWVVNDPEEADEALQPKGAVIIEVDARTQMIKRLFVKGESHITREFPTASDTETIIEWVEEETGLQYGRQFKRTMEEKTELYFHAAVDNIPVFPAGSIHIKFNEKDELTLFSIDGDFPSEEEIHWEPFNLTSDLTEKVAKKQCRILELPIEEKENWISVYHIPPHFVSNDGKEITLEDELQQPENYVMTDKKLEWNEAIDGEFEKKEINLSPEVSVEQAFENTEPLDQPLTNEELTKSAETAKQFMQQEFPDDSGEWILTGLWPEHGYIFAEIKRVEPDPRLIERKIKLIIDRNTLEAMNYMNNDQLLEMIAHFQPAETPVISKEVAFEKLKNYMDVIPVYVYHREKQAYYLCGRAACGYGVETKHGDILLLNQK